MVGLNKKLKTFAKYSIGKSQRGPARFDTESISPMDSYPLGKLIRILLGELYYIT